MIFKTRSDKSRKIHLNMDLINQYVSRYLPHTEFEIDFKRKVKRKSDPMRKYYFAAVLPPILDELGYERDEDLLFHKQMKIDYFRVKPDKHGIYRDKDIPSVFGDDSDLDIEKKQAFIEWLRRRAAQYGIYTPDPGE